MIPSRRKSPWIITARSPVGSTVRKRGRRKEPINAMPKIMTGKRAKLRLPKMVEWIRHSSFIIFAKRLGMGDLLHNGEEEIVQVLLLCGKFCDCAVMEKFTLVQDRKFRTNLFCDPEDMG
jgi:hypothetical protein